MQRHAIYRRRNATLFHTYFSNIGDTPASHALGSQQVAEAVAVAEIEADLVLLGNTTQPTFRARNERTHSHWEFQYIPANGTKILVTKGIL